MLFGYPAHVKVINAAFTPTADAVAHARQVVQVYEAALSAGNAAAQIDGNELIVQDYKHLGQAAYVLGIVHRRT